MSTSVEDKTYQKYKLTVKRWEKEFVKNNGRIPSKLDIKEAPQNVRAAYKYYFNFKSKILETSLMDATLDEDESTICDGFFEGENQELFESQNSEDSALSRNIPSVAEIGLLMHGAEKLSPEECKSSLPVSHKVWGKHLNNKSKESKQSEKPKETKSNISTKLFKSCSFNLRNPRKSLPSLTQNSSTSDLSIIELEKSVSFLEEEPIQSNLAIQNVLITKQDVSSLSQPVQCSLKNISMSRNIDSGWLNRCSESSLLEKGLPSISSTNAQDTDGNTPTSYGLKNMRLHIDISKYDDSHLSDFVENSESEPEGRQSNYKKIKPVVKKLRLDENILKKPHTKVSSSDLKDEIVNVTQKTVHKNVPVDAIKKPRKKNNNKKSNATKPRSRPERKVSKKKEMRVTSESECDDKSEIITKVKRRSKKVLDDSHFDFSEDCENEFTNHLSDEKISFPRFPLRSSILKESNLVDSIAAALDVPNDHIKSNSKEEIGTAEDAIKNKIKNGTLNDNFVSLNLEKKVYARGKKNMNFSKYKKQQWKNKKKMLNYCPEFPEGGVLKCFKCGQAGHMSRYCKNQKQTNLLPLEECPEVSPCMSIQEAEELNKKQNTLFMENVAFECIKVDESEGNVPDFNAATKGMHKIPETFIKLLSSTPITVKSCPQSIEPVYPLLANYEVTPTPHEVREALSLFGHSQFRDGQEKAVMRILSGLSTLVTLSTGSGKSLCYQLPAYIYAKHNRCITLVISPLVSLMEDQVVNMPGFLQGVCLHTNQTPTQRDKIMQSIKNGLIHILLVSPEAIVAGERSTGFGAILRQLPPIAFACIDEVHCVSQWSHNFRPSYLMICRVLREKLGVKCILGLTATATAQTIEQIVDHLNIPDGIESVITNKPLPDNLVLTVSRDFSKDTALLELLKSERFSQCHSIIVYCIRRDECERVASLLRSSMQDSRLVVEESTQASKKRKRFNWVVEAYHAGMSAAKRKRVQQAFMSGELRIVVATVAFGMGINKSDIRGVIHYNMPSSFESYVQEVGRAGRDGSTSQCHLFIGSDYKDKDELLRHIHANSIERHSVRRLLQKVFVPCGCDKIIQSASQPSVTKCDGHEVAFAVEQTVSELDIPSENISTLLCYLELHPKKYARVLSNVYIMCKICSYGGTAAILKAAEKCPPLAMALALEKKRGCNLPKSGILEFCVIEVAAAIGWESGVVKYHLKNLEWDKSSTHSKKSLLKVEFNTLGFRVKSPGDLTSSELDSVLDSLYDRTQLQEKSSLYQLHEVFEAMSNVSFRDIFECSELKNAEMCKISSEKLKQKIRGYFERKSSTKQDIDFIERPINRELVISDVRGLLSTYRDCTFTGRAVARILQGISSPNFPAIIWGRCRYWRSHLSEDFYKLVEIAKEQIISMR